jgi:hypothetical protein
LRSFVLAKLSSFGFTYEGRADHYDAPYSIAVLAAEILRLQWPLPWLARLFRGYAIGMRTSFCHWIRCTGKMLPMDDNVVRCCSNIQQNRELFDACYTCAKHTQVPFLQ